VPEILDRDLSRPDGVRWLLSFALRAMTMLATSEKENSEEKRDAATHSLFCERISAETGTGGQRRQRRHRPRLVGRDSSIFHDDQFAGREARNQTGDIPVARRNAQAKALGLLKPTERLTSETLLPLQEMFRVVRPGGKVVVMDAVPAAAKSDRFDAFEKLRDPSHASALTMEELIELGERCALTPVRVRRLRLRIELESHLSKSLSTPVVAGQCE
jgi:hypothetical protein